MVTGTATGTTRRRKKRNSRLYATFFPEKETAEDGAADGHDGRSCPSSPGVDDGIRTFGEAEEAVRYLERLGVRRMVLTPHVMEDYASNTAATLTEQFTDFCRRIPSSIRFTLAAEYMLDAAFQQRRSEPLLLLGKQRILVETSYMAGPPDLLSILYDLSVSGLIPVIAHPERYLYLSDKEIEALKTQGYELQMNLMSLAGIYGNGIRRRAELFLEKGWYTYVGSDLHRLSVYQHALQKIELSRKQIRQIETLFTNNEKLF